MVLVRIAVGADPAHDQTQEVIEQTGGFRLEAQDFAPDIRDQLGSIFTTCLDQL